MSGGKCRRQALASAFLVRSAGDGEKKSVLSRGRNWRHEQAAVLRIRRHDGRG
jgi:hypothetical protein